MRHKSKNLKRRKAKDKSDDRAYADRQRELTKTGKYGGNRK